jgi:hypothetical protein
VRPNQIWRASLIAAKVPPDAVDVVVAYSIFQMSDAGTGDPEPALAKVTVDGVEGRHDPNIDPDVGLRPAAVFRWDSPASPPKVFEFSYSEWGRTMSVDLSFLNARCYAATEACPE